MNVSSIINILIRKINFFSQKFKYKIIKKMYKKHLHVIYIYF